METRPLLELLEVAQERDAEERRLEEQRQVWRREAGLKLRSARRAAGLSQGTFAALAHVPQPYVSAVESGTKTVSTDQLRKFHTVLAGQTTTGGAENGTVQVRAEARKQGKARGRQKA